LLAFLDSDVPQVFEFERFPFKSGGIHMIGKHSSRLAQHENAMSNVQAWSDDQNTGYIGIAAVSTRSRQRIACLTRRVSLRGSQFQ
jgi:hypothetical protein